ncbi:MAG: Hsp20/alpha crystallin family protein [Rickettsiales bacterium]|jgi:HSP20 family molecular chaperone IbpA|nr:Hsp20/alpha crystallin family protein [Rickettsiales bacterium]
MKEEIHFFQRVHVLLVMAVCLVFACCLLFLKNKRLEGLLFSDCRRDCGACTVRSGMDGIFSSRLNDFRLNEFETRMGDLATEMENIQDTLNIPVSGEGEQLNVNATAGPAPRKGLRIENRPVIAFWAKARMEAKTPPKREREFSVLTNYREGDGEYVVEISLPNGFRANDVSTLLHDSVLTLKTGKRRKSNFFRVLIIPKTSAITKNIKRKVAGNRLRLRIPIDGKLVGGGSSW